MPMSDTQRGRRDRVGEGGVYCCCEACRRLVTRNISGMEGVPKDVSSYQAKRGAYVQCAYMNVQLHMHKQYMNVHICACLYLSFQSWASKAGGRGTRPPVDKLARDVPPDKLISQCPFS